jgi:hypothetical protein
MVLLDLDLLVFDLPPRRDHKRFGYDVALVVAVVMEDQMLGDLPANLAVQVVPGSIVPRVEEDFEDYLLVLSRESVLQKVADSDLDPENQL